MKLLGGIVMVLTLGALLLAFVSVGPSDRSSASPSPRIALGKLRCEGGGAIVINVEGRDYAVNGMAGAHYPPIQTVWTKASHPEIDIDRLIVQGITLCDWRNETRASSR